jgi:hypothetical protein
MCHHIGDRDTEPKHVIDMIHEHYGRKIILDRKRHEREYITRMNMKNNAVALVC